MGIMSDWQKKTRQLMSFNKQFGAEEMKYEYRTPSKEYLEIRYINRIPHLLPKKREPKLEIIQDVSVSSIKRDP